MLLDNVIDYLYVNFKALSSPEKKEQGDEKDGEFGSDEEKEYEVDGGGIVAQCQWVWLCIATVAAPRAGSPNTGVVAPAVPSIVPRTLMHSTCSYVKVFP